MIKKIFFICYFIINGYIVFAQTDTAVEKAIRATLQQMEDAWNKNDMNAYTQFLTEDGTWINVVGMFWRNKKEAVKAHLAFADVLFKYSTVTYDLIKLRYIAPDVTISYVKWTYTTTQDFNLPDGKTSGGKKGDVTYSLMELMFVKQNNQWLITSVTNTNIDLKAASYDPIKRD